VLISLSKFIGLLSKNLSGLLSAGLMGILLKKEGPGPLFMLSNKFKSL